MPETVVSPPVDGNPNSYLKDLKIDKNVFFTGKVKYDLIPVYYNLFNILVSFSKTETQGLTIIEALASSTPALCINDDSFKKMITHEYNGYLFQDGKEYISLVENLICNTKLYNKLAHNALSSAEEYSKETFAKRVLEVYIKAIERKKDL